MNMEVNNMKQFWESALKIYRVTAVIFVGLFVFGLLFYIVYLIISNKAIEDNRTINTVALILGLLSLPGIFEQLASLYALKKKREYILSQKCPEYGIQVNLKLIESD